MSGTILPVTLPPTTPQPDDEPETTQEAGKRLKRESDAAMAAWLKSLPPEQRDVLSEVTEVTTNDEHVFPTFAPDTPIPKPRDVPPPPNAEDAADPKTRPVQNVDGKVPLSAAEASGIMEAMKLLRDAGQAGLSISCRLCRGPVPLGQIEIGAEKVICRQCRGEPDDIDPLTQEESDIFEMRRSGKSETEIAAEYVSPKTGQKLSQPTVARRLKAAKTKLGQRNADVRRRRAAVGSGE